MYFQKLLAYATQYLPEYTLRFDETTGLVTHDIDRLLKTEPLWSFVRNLFYDCGDHVLPEDFEEELFEERLLHDQVTEEDLGKIRTYLLTKKCPHF